MAVTRLQVRHTRQMVGSHVDVLKWELDTVMDAVTTMLTLTRALALALARSCIILFVVAAEKRRRYLRQMMSLMTCVVGGILHLLVWRRVWLSCHGQFSAAFTEIHMHMQRLCWLRLRLISILLVTEICCRRPSIISNTTTTTSCIAFSFSGSHCHDHRHRLAARRALRSIS